MLTQQGFLSQSLESSVLKLNYANESLNFVFSLDMGKAATQRFVI